MSGIRASRRKHHIIYKTTCLVTGRYYIGMHSTDDLDDGYLGSGVRLNRSVAKHGVSNHTRVILEELPSREAASNREKELITAEMRADPNCLNCGPGGLGAVDRPPTSEETGKKITEANIRRWAREKRERAEANAVESFTMTREQILAELLDGESINKNVKRNLRIRDVPSRSREAAVARKWNFIYNILQTYAGKTPMDRVLTYVSAAG